MKCPNEDCESHEFNDPDSENGSEDMDTADASVQWTATETLDHKFYLNTGEISCINGGETSECTAIRGKPRPYVRAVYCSFCGEEIETDELFEKMEKVTPEQIRKTFREMPFPEWKISGRKKK